MRLVLALLFLMGLCSCNTQVPSAQQVAVEGAYVYNSGVLANSGSPSSVVAKLSSADLTGCPEDFTKAFKAYVEAWEIFSPIAKEMYAKNMKKATADLSAFIGGFAQNPTAAAVELKRQWPEYSAQIDKANSSLLSAFSAMKSVGVKYNAVYNTTFW